MRHNVIILTSGLSGSSVLTGLIARAGYWTGVATHRKWDYETYENTELIELNRRLLVEVGYTGDYQVEFSPEVCQRVSALHSKIACGRYEAFINRCIEHEPWIWKDPRLCLTIGFWSRLLELRKCRFIVLSRGLMQSWISRLLRRQIVTYRYSKAYEEAVTSFVSGSLNEIGVPFLPLTYEGLIISPGDAIKALNTHLGTELSVEDLRMVYRRPLYRSPKNSSWKHLLAMGIYLKNYGERIDVGRIP